MKKYISILNVLACLSVVLLHTNGVFWDFSYSTTWLSANVIECIFYFAVPVFFMNTGATLIDYNKRYDTRTFFRKRFSKTLIPFLFWSLIALFYYLLTTPGAAASLGIRSIFDGIFNTRYVSIYWFFIALFTVYFCIPVFACIPESVREKAFIYIIALSFILNNFLPFVFGFFNGMPAYNYALNMPLGRDYLLYVLLGYLIDRSVLKKKTRRLIYTAGIVGLLVHIFGTWYLSYQTGAISGTFKGYLNVPCILYSAAIFTFFQHIDAKKIPENVMRLVSKIAPTTFGIYLMHWYVMNLFLHITGVDPHNIVYRLGGGVLIFAMTGLLTFVLSKVPIIKRVIP